MIPNGVIFGIIEQKIENDESESTGKIVYVARYTLHVSHFLVNTIYPHIVNIIYSTTHIIPTTILYKIQLYSIQLYRYYNTVTTM